MLRKHHTHTQTYIWFFIIVFTDECLSIFIRWWNRLSDIFRTFKMRLLPQSFLQQGVCSLQHFSSCNTKAPPQHRITSTTGGADEPLVAPRGLQAGKAQICFWFSPTTLTFSWQSGVWDLLLQQQRLHSWRPVSKTVISSNYLTNQNDLACSSHHAGLCNKKELGSIHWWIDIG